MAIQLGWPCALLSSSPPAVGDALSAPNGEQLAPQVIALAPRGPAWGTDEAGDGEGASPVMRGVWTAVAGWAADLYAAAFDTAIQCFPSAISFSLLDWEEEYGLPDPCFSGASGTSGRVAAVRARFGAVGGSSAAYFICLAASIGYDITIEEPTQFHCDVSECLDVLYDYFRCDEGECDLTPLEGFDEADTDGIYRWHCVSDLNLHDTWIVHFQGDALTWFRPDEGVVDETPLEGYLIPAELECAFRRHAPVHTTLIFAF